MAVMLFFQGWRVRLLARWLLSIVVSVLGMAASVWFDGPTGAAIVTASGAALIVIATLNVLLRRTRPA